MIPERGGEPLLWARMMPFESFSFVDRTRCKLGSSGRSYGGGNRGLMAGRGGMPATRQCAVSARLALIWHECLLGGTIFPARRFRHGAAD